MKKPKPNRILLGIEFSFVVLMTNACNSINAETKRGQILLLETQNLCAMPLAPYLGNNISDHVFQKHQQFLLKNTKDSRYMENLGWTYGNKTKNRFDPGFYKLKNQTVKCMNPYQPNSIVNKNRIHF